MTPVTIVLGAGPTGLGAAWRLHELGRTDWKLFDRMDRVGGLSTSYQDGAGFTWDVGGHVLFSHFEYFDRAIDLALAGDYFSHERECWVRILDTWVPYPFQNNIRYLPDKAREECVQGLRQLSGDSGLAVNFHEWMNAVFGQGIVKYFMAPYNFKVWATPPELMSKSWIAERVSVVDLERIEMNIREQIDEVAWGPNNLFKFPRKGGTGAIFSGISKPFQDQIRLNHELTMVDLATKQLTFSTGLKTNYDHLVSTIPIDKLIALCVDVPDEVRIAATKLVHNSAYVIGLGFKGRLEDSRCWMYFPEDNCPFYRVTNFSNYSPWNVPGGDVGNFYSLMCEVSYSPFKVENKEDIIDETIEGLVNTGLIRRQDRSHIVSQYLIDAPYAYPVPTLERDDALAVIQPFLESNGVYSRGRFGAWKYEVGNMDHSFMQGVEAVNRLLEGTPETVVDD